MRCHARSLVLVILFLSVLLIPKAQAQVEHIAIPAGTDEDRELQAISNEQDPQKKLAMYEGFVQKFSSNADAVAYGNWQISQAYQATGDFPKALEYGDKALVGSPHNLDILVSQASAAQQAKNNAKLMEYVAKGGEVCASIAKQAKSEGMSDDDFARKVSEDKSAAQNSCDFLDSSGFNAIASETDPKSRMAYIEKFTAGFPDSKYQEQVSGYALYTISQLNDPARLVSFCEKTLATFLFGRSQARQRRQGNYVCAEGARGGEGGRSRRRQVTQDFCGSGTLDTRLCLYEARQNRGVDSRIKICGCVAEGTR